MNIEKQILDFLKSNPESSSNQILENIEEKKSIATIKRVLSKLVSENLLDINFRFFINYLKILIFNDITKKRLMNAQ